MDALIILFLAVILFLVAAVRVRRMKKEAEVQAPEVPEQDLLNNHGNHAMLPDTSPNDRFDAMVSAERASMAQAPFAVDPVGNQTEGTKFNVIQDREHILEMSNATFEFVLMDVETSGLDPREDELVEISAIIVDQDYLIRGSFHRLVKPSIPISPDVMSIHNITNAMVDKDGIEAFDAVEAFFQFVGNRQILAYNADFEEGFIAAATSRSFNAFIDVLWPAKQFFRTPDHKLTTVAAACGASTVGAHRAENDCMMLLAVVKTMRFIDRLTDCEITNQRVIHGAPVDHVSMTTFVKKRTLEETLIANGIVLSNKDPERPIANFRLDVAASLRPPARYSMVTRHAFKKGAYWIAEENGRDIPTIYICFGPHKFDRLPKEIAKKIFIFSAFEKRFSLEVVDHFIGRPGDAYPNRLYHVTVRVTYTPTMEEAARMDECLALDRKAREFARRESKKAGVSLGGAAHSVAAYEAHVVANAAAKKLALAEKQRLMQEKAAEREESRTLRSKRNAPTEQEVRDAIAALQPITRKSLRNGPNARWFRWACKYGIEDQLIPRTDWAATQGLIDKEMR